ncbi:hypothetical protein AA0Y32_08480 [Georgenia phoenicis]|uniref:hypothetical protein n=1 Tax=unclassified Georgenia TaxID=2626815 RepID=UPI0039B0C768
MTDTLIPDGEAWERDVGFRQRAATGRPRPPREQPPNAGQPWTDADYEEILAAAREGVTDIDDVAKRLGRTHHPTFMKAKQLLPVGERAAPVDRIMRLLREHLDDPDYDWQRTTLEKPPPPPIIKPPALTGIAGLESDDLVRIAYALTFVPDVAGEDLLTRIGRQLQTRYLRSRLIDLRAERVERRNEVGWGQAVLDATGWLDRVLPSAGREPWYPDDDAPEYYW